MLRQVGLRIRYGSIKYQMISRLLKGSLPWGTTSLRGLFATLKRPSLNPTDMLLDRHIGPNELQTAEMLKTLEVHTLKELVEQSIPIKVRDPEALADNGIGEAVSEHEFLQQMKTIFNKNKLYKCYIGRGYYPNITPSVIMRNLFENTGWYTAYTPYQSEVSQGRLESLINYQTMVQEITQLKFSNASLLDEASAGGQALYMSYNLHDGHRNKIFIDEQVFETTIAVIKTKARLLNIEVVVDKYTEFFKTYSPKEFCGVVVQTPDSKGILHDFTDLFAQIDACKCEVTKIVASDLLSMCITKSPGEMGADVCFGSAQRFGIPMGFGGPYAGFYSTREQNIRKMPGRIIGLSKDVDGNPAYRMALQTREQHIRREKATSNICTAQALLANVTAMYAVYHGAVGLKNISRRVNLCAQLADRIFEHYGFSKLQTAKEFCSFFDTITIVDCHAAELNEAFLQRGININVVSDKEVSLSFNETTKQEDLQQISAILAEFTHQPELNVGMMEEKAFEFLPNLTRKDKFMFQKIFNGVHSETQMMRYLRALQEKDISLNRSMISLGSCTMKLNAASQMMPLTWPELNLHPFVPVSQAEGYLFMIEELRRYLKSITRFDEISFQPNSGATGEYAGLLTIMKYLQSTGQEHRNICLIPKSAHGTNPASAALAGMKIIQINTINGCVDMDDLTAKAEKHQQELAAFMITFPSTTGKYENTITEMIDIVHKYGGQVYMDGANMNAQVGYTSPGYLGADVCHLNLHKTFAIPHGGGGPGMGPIGVRKHLIPYLPSHPYTQTPNPNSLGTISSAEYGSASILSISYGYIAMLGKAGVRKATAYAILNANYLMKRLQPHYKIACIQGEERCSHQFILDMAAIKKQTGVSQEDVAKRLIDYGFHSPTMSFPMPGTLMIEPTESEDKGELDRFAQALIKIREEIEKCPQILKNAPYTAEYLTKADWDHPFTREQAAYPLPWIQKRGKYWPPVRRVSNPFGDRNLVVCCPEVSSFVE